MHSSRSITQHYIAGNPYSWRRSSLQSTLYEASIAMQGMSYGGPPVARPHGTDTGPSKAARSDPKTSTRERKRARGEVREGGKKDEKALSSPQDCSYWDKREEPSGEPSPRPRAGPEREDGEKTDERKEGNMAGINEGGWHEGSNGAHDWSPCISISLISSTETALERL